jgi:hypothetical protein
MIPANITRILVAGSLALHGVAHVIALLAAILQSLSGASPSRLTLRSWLWPGLQPQAAAAFAVPFWALSATGFLAGAACFWGLLPWAEAWRSLAQTGALISLLGITAFSGIWPGSANRRRSMLNTAVAVAMNAVILVALLVLGWPPPAMFGR